MIYSVLKSLLFKMDAENAHHFVLRLSELYQASPYDFSPRLLSQSKNLEAPSPIGLAAGLDKNAQALSTLSSLGFGSLEAGTVTLKPQFGNARPRIWRYPDEESLRNAMGFPNEGMDSLVQNLKNYQAQSILGVNIGKNKDTTPEDSINELGVLVSKIHLNNYFTINVSSPNTPGLRALQEPGYLRELFSHLKEKTNKPLFLKIAPDLSREQALSLLVLACELELEGIIATNTTIMPDRGPGGVSGKLLSSRAHLIHEILLEKETPLNIIGVGGISSFKDILSFWKLGGSWVQIYTAFVFQGPTFVNQLNKQIIDFLDYTGIYKLDTFFKLPLSEKRKAIEDYENKFL